MFLPPHIRGDILKFKSQLPPDWVKDSVMNAMQNAGEEKSITLNQTANIWFVMAEGEGGRIPTGFENTTDQLYTLIKQEAQRVGNQKIMREFSQ